MNKRIFLLLLTLTTALGLFLRFWDYTKVPPINEAFDEVHYAWGGLTWIREGTPKSWSFFDSYKNAQSIERYAVRWKIVWPLIEKPPLYFLASGLFALPFVGNDSFDISHNYIRVLPIILSAFSIFLTGLIGAKVFGKGEGLVASALYATVPTVVLASRLSVAENLLTPIALAALYIALLERNTKKISAAVVVGLLSALAFLTKQVGIFVGTATAFFYFSQRQWQKGIIVAAFSALGVILFFIFGAFYDFHLFLSLIRDVRIAHSLSGVPEFIFNIFRYSSISAKDRIFADGTMLASYIFLFSAPLWFLRDSEDRRKIIFLAFPFMYLLLAAIGESGAGPYTFFGWYLYPLFPFLSMLMSSVLLGFYKKQNIFLSTLLLLTLGLSSVRFIFLVLGRNYYYLWQYTFILVVAVFLFAHILPIRIRRYAMLSFFGVFILINIFVDLKLNTIYPLVVGH